MQASKVDQIETGMSWRPDAPLKGSELLAAIWNALRVTMQIN